jgi:hypothetical protein
VWWRHCVEPRGHRLRSARELADRRH